MPHKKYEVIVMSHASYKSPSQRAFSHYLRTGRRLPEEMFVEEQEVELKFNPYHDPRNGQFTFAPGGAGTGSSHTSGHSRPNAPAKPKTYTVRKGDTLSHIARRHGVRTDALARANNIKHPDHIQAGQTLRIPHDAPPQSAHHAFQHPKPPADTSSNDIVVIGRRLPDNAVDKSPSAHIWPVAGGGKPAKHGAISPNKKPYSDGHYDPSGTYRNGRPHYGIDLPATSGDTVQAAASGKIYYVGAIPGYGKTVAILHPDGNVSMYAHLDKYGDVKVGTSITKGDAVGVVGNSGNAVNRGTHLHFEVRKYIGKNTLGKVSNGAKPIDPTRWIEGQ
jgi:murein DD-endopeptidase MepM/ murein hydrolase activator NlpD